LAENDPMPHVDLVDILRPSLAPCVEIAGVCAGVVRYEPSAGYVPRGWIGGSGPREKIQLVLVTAEPGDPVIGEQYPENDPDETMRVYSAFSRAALKGMDLRRGAGHVPPFQTRLRQILDLFWPDVGIDEQLSRTWIITTVLCSAPVSSGPIPRAIEVTCGTRYLKKTLEALPGAFVVALGEKAAKRLAQIGMRAEAKAQHPSARANTNPAPPCSAAAGLFHEYLRRQPS
jgi:hypothetical protein